MSEEPYRYPGEELELFSLAQNWKSYWAATLRPYVTGRVLEVGGGTGENIGHLLHPGVTEWLSIEPDAALFATLQSRIQREFSDGRVTSRQCTLIDLDDGPAWDTAIYLDVLEHIEDDQAELARAACKMKPGGTIIVLSPAHQWLFSKFDAAIGHCRRYDRAMIEKLNPPGCKLEQVLYLDSVGMLASMANRLMLRQSYPTASQIRLWDRRMVPLSRHIDPLVRYCLGKTIIGIWRKL
jgi:SAM-dependent methyltransferase